ncbi:MAG: MucB/RseB C-terminal domain-containing protein [Pseudomonadota bacterium]
MIGGSWISTERFNRGLRIAPAVLLYPMLMVAPQTARADDVETWLNRMTNAVERYNYRGTMARRFDGRVEYMSVVHRFEDGQVSERIETLDGASRTLIRDENGVRCVWPDSKAVLYQDPASVSGVIGRVPISLTRMRGQYDAVLVRMGERVADRKTVQLALRPHDEFRYGHRVWLEKSTALPLKTELLDELGRVIDETRFVSFTLEETIADAEFELDINVSGFRQIGTMNAVPAKPRRVAARPDDAWLTQNLPAGFKLTHHSESEDGMTHLRFDDGMASVSVFIEDVEPDGKLMAGASRLGGTHTYSVQAAGRQVTAVGEIPLTTARAIAEAISRSEIPTTP